MAKKVYEFPFVAGQSEAIDPRLLQTLAPQGTLLRAQNVRLRKDGRLGVRRDYAALSMTAQNGTLVATDVVNHDGRLVAFGDTQSRGFPTDLFEFLGSGTAQAWAGTEGTDTDMRIGQATALRDLGRIPSPGVSATFVDVAAANGFVCLVSSDGTNSFIHVFRADTGQSLLVERSTASTGPAFLQRPRVVAIGNVFYIAGIPSAGTSVDLRTFTPATDNGSQTLSTPFAAGASIVAWDMTVNDAGTELIMAVARSTPTSEIRRVNTAGTTVVTITGPATLANFCTCANDGTLVFYCDVVNATRQVRLTSFAVAGGAAVNGPTTLFASGTTLQQAALVFRSSTQLRVLAQIDVSPTIEVQFQDVTRATHALSAVTRWGNSYLVTKGLARPIPPGTNSESFFGGRFFDPDCTNFLAIGGDLFPDEQVIASKEHYISAETVGQIGHLARDAVTGSVYWPQLVQDVDGLGIPIATELQLLSSARQPCASLGGHLYLCNGQSLVYDTKQLVETGFADVPVIFSTVGSTAAGNLTLLGLYSVAVTWEWTDALGHLHTSAPSDVAQVTLTGTQNTVTVVASSPHSSRRNGSNEKYGGACKVVAWVTVANGTVLQRSTFQLASITTYGQPVTLTILGPDTTTAAQAILYTQGARGALSGPLPFETPLPARYMWASKERILLGGLPDQSSIQESRALFPNEPIQWSLGLGFFTAVRGVVTAVFFLDEQRFVCTRDEIFIVPGEGIDDNGNGTLGPPIKLPAPGGCIDWRSVVETPMGVFFQLDSDKIFLQPRGGNAPTWVGQPVRDTLAAFPVIVSATLVAEDQTVCFACNNSAGTDGRIVVFDMRSEQWFVDVPLSAETYRGSCQYQGRHVIAKGTGTVHQQLAVDTPATFVPVVLESGDIYVGGPDGWGQYYGASLLAEFRGNCTVVCNYSLDGGLTYSTADRVYSLSGLTVGSRVRRTWTFGPFQNECVRVKFTTAALSGAATAGLVFQSFGIYAEPIEGFARVPADSIG